MNVDATTLLALLEERHVTRAAARLGIGQSSLSHRLRALRARLNDPLLVRGRGGALVLTPRAERMLQPLRQALQAVDAAVSAEPFAPSTTRAVVRLALPDLVAPLVTPILRALQREAPFVSLHVVPLGAQLETTLGADTWLALSHLQAASAPLRARRLAPVPFGLTVRRGHPLARGPVTPQRWLSFPHVVVRGGQATPNAVAQRLETLGLQRTVGLEVPTFLSGLVAVASSDLVMNAPRPLVESLAPQLGLVVRAPPVELPTLHAALFWHERFHDEPAHRWAREVVFTAVRAALART